jgi:hypothetical protein
LKQHLQIRRALARVRLRPEALEYLTPLHALPIL